MEEGSVSDGYTRPESSKYSLNIHLLPKKLTRFSLDFRGSVICLKRDRKKWQGKLTTKMKQREKKKLTYGKSKTGKMYRAPCLLEMDSCYFISKYYIPD